MKRNTDMIISFAAYAFLLGTLIEAIGTPQDAYVVEWRHVISLTIGFWGIWAMGYYTRKSGEKT